MAISINQAINEKKEFMSNQETIRKCVHNIILTKFIQACKEVKRPLTEQEKATIVQQELKQIRQILHESVKANDEPKAYTPTMMNELDIIHYLLGIGASKGDNPNRLMSQLMIGNEGRVDEAFAMKIIQKYFG